jgi:hypothetical protein
MAATNAAKAAAAKKDVISDTKEIVEDVKELVEDGIGFFEDSVELVKKSWIVRSNPKVVASVAALAGLALGAALTYTVVSKRLSAKAQKFADEQIEDVKANYTLLRKDGVDLEEMASRYPDEQKVAERPIAEKIIRENGYIPYEKVPAVVEEARVEETTVTEAIIEATLPRDLNVFESDMPETYFLFEEELKRREAKPFEPFVITKEEFDDNETDYEQATLTYYAGDDVVTDQQDKTIDEPDPIVGPENTLRFGHGSGDPNVVYIRNNRLKIDIELVHSPGKYTKEVLGFDDGEDSLKHSAPRRFRPDRD